MSMSQARKLTGDALRTWLVFAALGACHAEPPLPAAHAPLVAHAPAPAHAPVEVLTCVDLPRDDPRSHDLSGLAWDANEHLLYAISDRAPWIVVLAPRADLSGYELREPIPLDLPVERWDGEALALAGDRILLVADETEQAVFSVLRDGRGGMRVELPGFAGMRHNLGLEGLGYLATPGGRYVFAANEQALEGDGPTSSVTHGTVVRLLRHRLDGGPDLEVAYLTDPIFAAGVRGDNGVSDIAPLSPDRMLVLERAWVQGSGNSVRLYDVDLRTGKDVLGLADARDAAPVAKRLVVDIALLPDAHCAPPAQWQRRRTLENYEGMTFGPTLPDGRRVLFLVSDDNSRATQDARILALALAPGAL
ncbi:MAG TPA: esterase-like activity of phytase family protein [Kofleriaceae bacterium]|nr:esterase-like activity of phytase family protein [Kofleriaceae bacterium]